MPRSRQTRLITVFVALFSLLFMQLALAGYACPGYGAKVAQQSQMQAMADMPCAESMLLSMDDEQPHLCQAHCQSEGQSAGQYQPPSPVAVEQLPVNFTLQSVPLLLVASEPFLGHPPYLQRSTAPPIAIRNCCFRI
jgi:hypothetical protein